MFGLSPAHLILILLVVVLVFGTAKLKNVGKDLGSAVKGFKEAMKDPEKQALLDKVQNDGLDKDWTIDGTAKHTSQHNEKV